VKLLRKKNLPFLGFIGAQFPWPFLSAHTAELFDYPSFGGLSGFDELLGKLKPGRRKKCKTSRPFSLLSFLSSWLSGSVMA
jgi:hypothetical protein